MQDEIQKPKDLRSRLAAGEHVVAAEGYLIELERRCWARCGPFAPEIVLERPEIVRQLHEELVHAGSDVVQAYTYYGHRARLTLLGKEDSTEELNRSALRLAKAVAVSTGTLMAGNLSNTNLYQPDNAEAQARVRAIFKEQIEWAVEEGADFIIGETFMEAGEAYLALECIQQYGKGLPAVVTVQPPGEPCVLFDGVSVVEACRVLEERGADVVGLNCGRGLDSMVPLIKQLREVCKGPLACLPNPYRTTTEAPCYTDLVDEVTGRRAYPNDTDAWLCSRSHVAKWTEEIKDMVQYIGLCCGNRAHYTRALAMALGRLPPAARWMPDYSVSHLTTSSEEYARSREKMTQTGHSNAYGIVELPDGKRVSIQD